MSCLYLSAAFPVHPKLAENTREEFSWSFSPLACEQGLRSGLNAWTIIAHHCKGREVPLVLTGNCELAEERRFGNPARFF